MRIFTLNLRHDADRWSERFPLIVEQILQVNPDIIAFQEVALHIKQAHLIAKEVNRVSGESYIVYMEEKWGVNPIEGIAFLSRLESVEQERFELPEGGRIAQRIRISTDRCLVDVVNTHLHHLPKENESIRYSQITHLLMALEAATEQAGTILVGDFNAIPSSSTIKKIKERFTSAFFQIHSTEPELTFPTLLVSGTGSWYEPRTIDYIFFAPDKLHVLNAQLACTWPHPEDATLFPSDHFGLIVEIE